MAFADDFHGPDLDRRTWLPHYLPHWSSREESAATYAVEGSELRLEIPREQPLWCAETHTDPPLRVSGIQSGVRDGQQSFRDGLPVREHQATWWGLTPLAGIEDEPQRSGEICVFEVFGDAPDAIGMGIKPFRDPALTWDFEAPKLPIDVGEPHEYAACS